MEKLKEREDFPTYKPSDKFQRFLKSVDGDDLIKFLKQLVIYSEDNYSEIAKRINYLVDAETVYFGNPQTDGSWRITKSGNDFNFERRESGVWAAKGAFTP